MVTTNQIIKKKNARIIHKKSKKPALEQCPQKQAICLRVYTRTPKKTQFCTQKSD